jgi:TonB family protein
LGALIALAAVGLAPGAASAQSAEPARAQANLASYLTDKDYPYDAINRGEQGTVGFRLAIDAQGRVSGCTIEESSGSTALDSATCRIMVERARFTPARDAQGRSVADIVTNRIRWRLHKDSTPHSGERTAFEKWAECVKGETAKLAPTRLDVRAISRKAMAACVELEILTGQQLGTEQALIPARNQIRSMTWAQVFELRKAQAPRPAP